MAAALSAVRPSPAVEAIEQFRRQPVVAATLRQVLADRYVDMGLYDAAIPLQQSALATRRHLLGESDPATLQSINGMGGLLESQGKLDEAVPFYREARESRRRVLGEDHPDTVESMANMGAHLLDDNKLSEAEPYLRDAPEKSRRSRGEADVNTR